MSLKSLMRLQKSDLLKKNPTNLFGKYVDIHQAQQQQGHQPWQIVNQYQVAPT